MIVKPLLKKYKFDVLNTQKCLKIMNIFLSSEMRVYTNASYQHVGNKLHTLCTFRSIEPLARVIRILL